jgi:hypothetical protein
MNNNTAPEQRPDKNGKIVTRHVRTGEATKAPIVVPAPNLSLPAQSDLSKELFADVAGTDFSGMDEKDVVAAVTAVAASITKENFWDTLTLLTKGIETTDYPEALGNAMGENRTASKLRDTWLGMHGANMADRSYVGIDGPGGYEDYKNAFAALSEALDARVPRDEVPVPREIRQEGDLSVKVETPGVVTPLVHPTPEATVPVDDSYGDSLIAAGTSTDFSGMDENQIMEAATAVTNRISKDTFWSVLDVLTKATEDTDHKEALVAAIGQNGGATKLRDTWLNMHGANIGDRHAYQKIEGENGYERYRVAFTRLSNAAGAND